MSGPDVSETQGVEVEIAAALTRRLGGRVARVSLTETGRGIAQRLGAAWFDAAVRSLALAHPGAPLELLVVSSEHEPFPAPIDVDPAVAGGRFAEGDAVGRVSVEGEPGRQDAVGRTLVVPTTTLLDEAGEFHFLQPDSLKRRVVGGVYKKIYEKAPLLLDEWRQGRNTRVEHRRSVLRPQVEHLSTAGGSPLTTGEEPVAWIAMHWFESGGAESWAVQSAELAAAAGYRVVVTADVAAPQRQLDRMLEITDDVFVAANALAEEDWGAFLTALVRTYRPTLLHVHHSRRAYAFLPELRHVAPSVQVLDSTHIVEHRTGGFVRQSIELSDLIDEHHVISPELRDLYLLDSEVDRRKLVYRPLTSGVSPVPAVRPRSGGPLRIGYLGRLAPQKRPFLYVALAARLHAKAPADFSFVMQGSGVLGAMTSDRIRKEGLEGVIERRPWGPVGDFMDDVDVLVISSDNEGLTLTSLEAEEHGVLVLSADVGSQRTVVAPMLLVPRAPRGFLSGATQALVRLAGDPDAYERARREQTQLIQALHEVEPASAFLARRLEELKEKN
ncbi:MULTISPECIES: glycosyltransferase [Cellulosimicrobium]|uniref:Glycosyltransferase n=1 Tax=Cellulosimicrobium sp. ES-005 TaxID=3163031 RepID=A0AAU8G3Q0_9MICO|nr:glycosyltransferase [Cellulosimicrobium cellulans]MCO7274300.1 glycosyltransferase [Cellulosimicrobium cellulans]